MNSPVLVLVLTAAISSEALPPVRHYGYEDGLRRAPAPWGGLGPKLGGRDLGDHATWCPLRAREALRPVQRLPPLSKVQGPGYFNFAQDDEDAAPRYGRSQRNGAHLRPIDDFADDEENADLDEGGVNVGGVLWQRPLPKAEFTPTENSNHDVGCNHKAAAFAKDATAAAANAATASAAAARAAARATAAAAWNPEGILDDVPTRRSEESNEESPDDPLGFRVEYPGNRNQGAGNVFQENSESGSNFQGRGYQDTMEDSQGGNRGIPNRGNNWDMNFLDSENYGDREVNSKHRDSSVGDVNSPENDDTEMYPDDDTGNRMSSESGHLFAGSTYPGINPQKVNSKSVSDSILHSALGDNVLHSKGNNALGNPSARNSQGITHSSPVRADAGKVSVNSQGAAGRGANNSTATSKGNSQGDFNRVVSFKNSTDSEKYPQGSVTSEKSRVSPRESVSGGQNSKSSKVSQEHRDISEKANKTLTLTNMNRQDDSSEDDE